MKKYSWRLLLLLVFFGGMGVMHFVLNDRGFYNIHAIDLKQVEVAQGTERYFQLVSMDVYSQLRQFEGVSLFDVDIRNVNDILSKQSWIEQFQVTRRWPNTLSLVIKTKQILVNVGDSSQKVIPISFSGEKLPAVELKNAPDRVFFDRVKMYSDLDLRQKSLEVLKEIPSEGQFSHRSIAVLGFEKDSGFWAKLIDQDVKVQLGFDAIAVKSKRVSQVIDHLKNSGIDPRVIEADMNKKVLVKTRKSLSN
jgi:cell division protein FtsQ